MTIRLPAKPHEQHAEQAVLIGERIDASRQQRGRVGPRRRARVRIETAPEWCQADHLQRQCSASHCSEVLGVIIHALNMIAKNEAPKFHFALQSAAKVCHEQILVSTGSTDRTVDFAFEHGASIYHHRLPGPEPCPAQARHRGAPSSGGKDRSDRSGLLHALRGAIDRGVAWRQRACGTMTPASCATAATCATR
jgi:hypothetical protein